MTTPKARAELTGVPAHSALQPLLDGADFYDAYRFSVSGPDQPPLGIFMAVMATPPAWVDRLMWLRNRVVERLGLKDLGRLGGFSPSKPLSEYRPGDRVGIFTIQEIRDGEIIMGDKDRHLDVWLSLCLMPADGGGRRAVLSTVVRNRNALGRLYMLVVKPLHRIIAPAVVNAYLARSPG